MPPGVLPLVKGHAHSVVLLDVVIELALHETVRAQRVLDVAAETELRGQLHRLEVLDILGVEEHVADDGALLVDLQRVASQDDALEDHCQRVRGQSMAGGKERQLVCASEQKDLAWTEYYRQVHRGDGCHVCAQESHVFQLITLTWARFLTECRTDNKYSEPTVKHHLSL